MAQPSKEEKLRLMFEHLDKNNDGVLSREELKGLILTVNSQVEFSEFELEVVLNEMFRTYPHCVVNNGLNLEGFASTYKDGAGDIDRDYDKLLVQPLSKAAEGHTDAPKAQGVEKAAEKQPAMDKLDHPPLKEDAEVIIPPAVEIRTVAPKPPAELITKPAIVTGPPKPPADIPLVPGAQAIITELQQSLAAAPRNHPLKAPSSGAASVIEVTQELRNKIRDLRTRTSDLKDKVQEHQVHMDMGQALADNGVHDEALSSLCIATELVPSDPRSHFRTGNTLYALGDVDGAIKNYTVALQMCQAAGYIDLAHKVHINMGIALEAKGMLMNSCEHYREAAILVPNNPRALKLLGSAMFGLGELRSAEEALQHALHLKPDYVDAYCDLGATLAAVGDNERALEAFQKAVQYNPRHTQVLFNLANLHRSSGDFDKAIAAYDQVLAQDPRHWRAHLNKAISLVALGHTKDARAVIEQAYQLSGMRIEVYDEMKAINKMSKNEAVQLSMPAQANERHRTRCGTLKGYQPARLRGTLARTMTKKVTSGRFSLKDLADAVDVALLQQLTPITKIDLQSMTAVLNELPKPSESPLSRTTRKPLVEAMLRKLLPQVPAMPFQYLIKAINSRFFPVLDYEKEGSVDMALLLSVLVQLTNAGPEERKSAAFDILVWRAGGMELARGQVRRYIACLIGCYSYESQPIQSLAGENDPTTVSRQEFYTMLDDGATGFPYLVSLPSMAHRYGWAV